MNHLAILLATANDRGDRARQLRNLPEEARQVKWVWGAELAALRVQKLERLNLDALCELPGQTASPKLRRAAAIVERLAQIVAYCSTDSLLEKIPASHPCPPVRHRMQQPNDPNHRAHESAPRTMGSTKPRCSFSKGPGRSSDCPARSGNGFLAGPLRHHRAEVRPAPSRCRHGAPTGQPERVTIRSEGSTLRK